MIFLIVYADILFLVNFIMDYFCLYVTGVVLSIGIKKLRLVCGSLIGAVYGVCSAIVYLPEPFFGIAVSAVMVLAAFRIKKAVAFAKATVLFTCVGMLMGGIMTFIQRVLYSNRNLRIFGNGVDFVLFLVMLAAIFVFVLLVSRLFNTYVHRVNVMCILSYGNTETKVRLLLDTGNMLKDPFTGKPVVIVKAKALDGLLGKDGIHRTCGKCNEDEAMEAGLRFVPVRTVSGSALLPVIGKIKVYRCGISGRTSEVSAIVACDASDTNDYSGHDGVMPYILEGCF